MLKGAQGKATLKPRVFIGSSKESLQIAEAAQKALEDLAEVEVWNDGKFPSTKTAIESLIKVLGEFDFALFVANPDDITRKRGAEQHTVRDNVLFEMGLFIGRLDRERVFLIAPKGRDLHLPSDLTGIEPSGYDLGASNTRSAVSSALFEMKEALRKFVRPETIFDARRGLRLDQLVPNGGRRHENGRPVSGPATAEYRQTNAALEITRTNTEGHWDIDVRPKGASYPTVVKSTNLRLHVDFDARVTAGARHTVRCVTLEMPGGRWIENQSFLVTEEEWTHRAATLRALPDADVLVRLQDEVEVHPSGTLYLRNIAITKAS